MFSGPEIVESLEAMGVSHLIWVPDSTLGGWEDSLEGSSQIRLVRVCREGEAWPLAAGLWAGGRCPIIMMQCTGFFESCDAMRNVVYDLEVPVFALVGVRNWLNADSPDSARRFAGKVADAWGLDTRWIASPADRNVLAEHYRDCRTRSATGVVLMAEGKG